MLGDYVVHEAELVQDAKVTFGGVVIYVEDGGGWVAGLRDIEDLDVSVFHEVRSKGDREVQLLSVIC